MAYVPLILPQSFPDLCVGFDVDGWVVLTFRVPVCSPV